MDKFRNRSPHSKMTNRAQTLQHSWRSCGFSASWCKSEDLKRLTRRREEAKMAENAGFEDIEKRSDGSTESGFQIHNFAPSRLRVRPQLSLNQLLLAESW